MIRVNLLRPIAAREGHVESLIRTGGASAFISRREVLLGLGCLALAAGVLVFQYGGSGGEERAAVEETPLVSAPQQPLIRDLDADLPGVAGGVDAAGDTASPATVDEAAQSGVIASNLAEPVAAATSGEVAPSAPVSPPPQDELPGSAPGVDSPPTPSAGLAAATPALRQLVVSSKDETLRIFAATGMQPEYTTFRLDNPKRVVIDLPGVRLTLPRDQHEQTPGHKQVSRIRAGQHQTNPPLVRIVLDVTSFPEVEVLPQFNGLYLIVTERPR